MFSVHGLTEPIQLRSPKFLKWTASWCTAMVNGTVLQNVNCSVWWMGSGCIPGQLMVTLCGANIHYRGPGIVGCMTLNYHKTMFFGNKNWYLSQKGYLFVTKRDISLSQRGYLFVTRGIFVCHEKEYLFVTKGTFVSHKKGYLFVTKRDISQ